MHDSDIPGRLLRLPVTGRLYICTDLHGNLEDFRRMREIFLQAVLRREDPYLLFTGDLIHGPSCQPEDWPPFLGNHYYDESGTLVEEFIALQAAHPDRVASLLGNHEHSHVGGPHTPKFWPDETLHFERTVGPQRASQYNELFRRFPAAAVSCCGVAVTHAAPNVELLGPEQLDDIRYDRAEGQGDATLTEMDLLGGLLWSRHCPEHVARRFLRALSAGGPPLRIVVYGHEIVPEGFERIGAEQLLLSSSFGVREENKYYLKLDLAGMYQGTHDLHEGQELLRLRP